MTRQKEAAQSKRDPKPDPIEREVAAQDAERPKRKYTKRKAKVRWNPDMSSETLQAVAEGPLIIANIASTSLLGVVLQYNKAQVEKLGPALGQLLQSMEIEVGPGWLCLGLYASVITTGVMNAIPVAVAQEKARQAQQAQQAQEKTAEASAPADPETRTRTVKVVRNAQASDAGGAPAAAS